MDAVINALYKVRKKKVGDIWVVEDTLDNIKDLMKQVAKEAIQENKEYERMNRTQYDGRW